MVRLDVVLLAAIPLTLIGCGSSPSETDDSHDSAFTAEANAALACDGDAAALEQGDHVKKVFDLDDGAEHGERDLRFIIRDRNVVDYLASKVDHLQNAQHQIELKGSLREGEAFDFFEDWSFGSATTRAEGNNVRIREQIVGVVHRVHGQADQVRVVLNRTTQRSTCSTYFEETHCAYDGQHDTAGVMSVERTDAPIADWVFRCATP